MTLFKSKSKDARYLCRGVNFQLRRLIAVKIIYSCVYGIFQAGKEGPLDDFFHMRETIKAALTK